MGLGASMLPDGGPGSSRGTQVPSQWAGIPQARTTNREGFSGQLVREHGWGRNGTFEKCRTEGLVILKLPSPPMFP